MASMLSVLKTVLNLNHNRIHVNSCEITTATVQRYGEPFEQERIIVHARPYQRIRGLCPKCRKKCPGYDHKQKSESFWRAPNLNGVPVYIGYQPMRIQCPEHGILTEYIPWADGNSRFTEDFNNEVAWMVCRMPKASIALFEDINWRTVGNCIKAANDRLEPDVSERMHCGLRRICVDETSYHKGFTYITVVYDMDRNRVVWIHDGNGLGVFRLFCEALTKEEQETIEIVAGDGARWIDTCVKEYFPNAIRCIDFFHVVEWANDALDKVRSATAAKAAREYNRRKEEYSKAEKEAEGAISAAREELASMPRRGRPSKRKKELLSFIADIQKSMDAPPVRQKGRPRKEQFSARHQEILDDLAEKVRNIKGAKHALGHNPENCTGSQADRIKMIENSYPDLYRAYQLKESLRLILHMSDPELARTELDVWIQEAADSGLPAMVSLSEKIKRHRDNILNSIENHANSAKSEATNTTIKVLIKMARGFWNLENMIALIYLKCSDLVIPLHNRCQMTPEQAAAARKAANGARKRRAAAPVQG